jgi:hypothetical protein
MAKRAHTNGSEDNRRYVVVIDRREEKGGVKRIKKKRDAALKLAERLNKQQRNVKVLAPNGAEIYPLPQAEGLSERSPVPTSLKHQPTPKR